MRNDESDIWRKLVIRAKGPQEEEAREEFYRNFRGFIFMLLHKMDVPVAKRQTLGVEILKEVWQEMKDLDPNHIDENFSPWLVNIIRDTVCNHTSLRHNHNSSDEHAGYDTDTDLPSEDGEEVDEEEFKRAMERINELEASKGHIQKLLHDSSHTLESAPDYVFTDTQSIKRLLGDYDSEDWSD